MGTRPSALAAALLVCVASPAVLAQPADGDVDMENDGAKAPEPSDAPPAPVKDPAVAKKWLQAATQLIAKGDQLTKQGKTEDARTTYDNAITAYQKAIDASEDASAIQLSLAIAQEKAGSAPEAMKTLKALVAVKGIKADLAKKAQSRLDELSMKVGVVALTIVPDGTSITVEGKQVGESPMSEPLVLMPGNHVVSLTAVGYQPKDVELKIEAGSESERKIELEPVKMTNKPDASPPDEDVVAAPAGPKHPDLLPIYVGGGATVGLLAIGTITGMLAIGKHSDYADETVDLARRADLRSSGKNLALVTDLCLLGAVGAAAFTTYWYMYKYRPEEKALAERSAMRHPKVDVVPWVLSDAGGLTAVGSF